MQLSSPRSWGSSIYPRMAMKLNIITPERIVYSDDIDQITIPTMDGEITVLPHHVPLVGILKAGELIIKKARR